MCESTEDGEGGEAQGGGGRRELEEKLRAGRAQHLHVAKGF